MKRTPVRREGSSHQARNGVSFTNGSGGDMDGWG
jgi:hypothetical protein